MKKILIICFISMLLFVGCSDNDKTEIVESNLLSNYGEDFNVVTEDDVILYKGWLISKELKEQYADFDKSNYSEDTLDGLNRMYYNYESGKFVGISEGKLSDNGPFEDTYIVENVAKIALSSKHNPILTTAITIDGVPQVLKNRVNFVEEQKVTSKVIDLDNDGSEEIIVGSKNDVTLYNANGEKIARLLYQEERAGWGFEAKHVNEIEFLDIDNDNITELIVPVPVYEGPYCVSILKYSDGILKGDIDVCCGNP